MTSIKQIISDRFWAILQEIDYLEADCPLELFKQRFNYNVSDENVLEVIHFLKKFDYPVCVKKVAGQAWIEVTGERKPVLLEMSFSNWLSLQAHAPFVKELEGREFHHNLKNCLAQIEKKYPHYDLSNGIVSQKNISLVPLAKQGLLNQLNKAVNDKKVLMVVLSNNKKYECYPHRVVYIDGDLTFIGEEVYDRCLVSYNFAEITNTISDLEKDYKPNFSGSEIDDFIYAIRTITGNEERLVLKITSPEKVNLKPDYQFLGNPYITVNNEGDFIWAASVEISNELFDWMSTIKEDIEILDPVGLQEKFLEYIHSHSGKKAA